MDLEPQKGTRQTKAASMTLEKFIAIMFVFAVAIGISLLTMIYGWGLHVQSWWWVVGMGFFGNMFVHFIARKLTE